MRRKTLSFRRLAAYSAWIFLGVALGAFTLLYVQGCSGPALQPWHTEELTAEFTASRADEIKTFDDYRRLENELFAELKEKVYDLTETGPGYELVRYSAGSTADPNDRKPDWNRSVELPAGAPVGGALLLHGMTDSPYSLRAIGETLNRHDYWVLGIRLPGHGTAPSGLTTVHWNDMAAAVKLGMKHLASKVQGKPIHIVGYSTGATLALDFALEAMDGMASPAPASLVLISPAIAIHPAAALAKWKRRLSALPGLGGLAWTEVLPEFDPYKYNSFATNAGEQVHRVTRSVSKRIAARSGQTGIVPPTLVFKSTVDATVSTDAVVDRLLKLLAPNRHELVLFDLNRSVVNSSLLVSDPGPLTARLMADEALPFTLTLVTNENLESNRVVARRKLPCSAEAATTEPLNLAWPRGVISLSHVALPFPLDDPLYGQVPPGNKDALFLGQMALQGERGLLRFPADWLLRLRHNPFYGFLETRVLEWVDQANRQSLLPDSDEEGAE